MFDNSVEITRKNEWKILHASNTRKWNLGKGHSLQRPTTFSQNVVFFNDFITLIFVFLIVLRTEMEWTRAWSRQGRSRPASTGGSPPCSPPGRAASPAHRGGTHYRDMAMRRISWGFWRNWFLIDHSDSPTRRVGESLWWVGESLFEFVKIFQHCKRLNQPYKGPI